MQPDYSRRIKKNLFLRFLDKLIAQMVVLTQSAIGLGFKSLSSKIFFHLFQLVNVRHPRQKINLMDYCRFKVHNTCSY